METEIRERPKNDCGYKKQICGFSNTVYQCQADASIMCRN